MHLKSKIIILILEWNTFFEKKYGDYLVFTLVHQKSLEPAFKPNTQYKLNLSCACRKFTMVLLCQNTGIKFIRFGMIYQKYAECRLPFPRLYIT